MKVAQVCCLAVLITIVAGFGNSVYDAMRQPCTPAKESAAKESAVSGASSLIKFERERVRNWLSDARKARNRARDIAQACNIPWNAQGARINGRAVNPNVFTNEELQQIIAATQIAQEMGNQPSIDLGRFQTELNNR